MKQLLFLLVMQKMLLTMTQWKVRPQHGDGSAYNSHSIQREERHTERKNFLEDLPPPGAELDNPDSSFGLIDSVLGQERQEQDMSYLGWEELGGLSRKEVWMTEGDMLVLKGGLLMDTNNLEELDIFGKRTFNHSNNRSKNKLKKIQKTSSYEEENEKLKYQGKILWHTHAEPDTGIREAKTPYKETPYHQILGRLGEGENLQLSFIKSKRKQNQSKIEDTSIRMQNFSQIKIEKIILH